MPAGLPTLLSVAAALLAAWAGAARLTCGIPATLPLDPGQRAGLARRMRRRCSRLVCLCGLVPSLTWLLEGRPGTGLPVVAIWLGIGMWVAVLATTAQVELVGRILGGYGSREALRGMLRWQLRALLGIAMWAGFGAALVPVLLGGASPLLTLVGSFAGTLLGLRLAGRAFQDLGPREPAAPTIVDDLRAAVGEPVPAVLEIQVAGQGMWNACAVSGRPPHIQVTADLLRLLPPPELTAVLCHEVGHLRLGHMGRRLLALRVGWLLVPALLAFAGRLTPDTATLSCLAGPCAVLLFAQRQEIEADRFAARFAPADVLGAALVRLHEAHLRPLHADSGPTHPSLAQRLTAIGLDADAFARQVPAAER